MIAAIHSSAFFESRQGRECPYLERVNCHYEHKNWLVVRHTIGYGRLETPEELAWLRSIYTDLRLYINFFQPVLKLVGEERVDGKTIRRMIKLPPRIAGC